MFPITDRLLVQARLDERQREAEAAHLARAARLARADHSRPGARRRSLRRALGRQLMRAGARLAADPSPRPARQI